MSNELAQGPSIRHQRSWGAALRRRTRPQPDHLEARALMAVVTPFTPRFEVNAPGNIAIVGNTLMTLPDSAPNADRIREAIGRGDELDNSIYDMVYVDIDDDPNTFNSSSATLGLPAGATVLFAGLYWGANSNSPDRGHVLLKAPGSDAYQSISGSLIGVVDDSGGIPMLYNYSEFADVTSIVGAAGDGAYTVANVQAETGFNRYAGWSLVIAFRAPDELPRNLTIFDGAALVQANNPTPVAINLEGFVTPTTGEVDADIGVIAYDGDLGATGDRMSFDGRLLSDALNPADDFFNSVISNLGVRATAKTPPASRSSSRRRSRPASWGAPDTATTASPRRCSSGSTPPSTRRTPRTSSTTHSRGSTPGAGSWGGSPSPRPPTTTRPRRSPCTRRGSSGFARPTR